MPQVIFQISYEIKPEKRTEYNQTIKELQQLFKTVLNKNYSVFEQNGKKNNFVEMFITINQEEFDKLEDDFDEKVETLNAKIQEMTVKGSVKYLTLTEVV